MPSKVQKMEITELPEDIQQFFFSLPQFREAIKIAGEKATVQKSLKAAPRASEARKGVALPFASILRGSMSRDVGTPPPPVQLAPAPTVKPFPAPRDTPAPSVGKPATLGRAHNVPKQPASTLPAASRDNPVSYRDLQAAIDAAMSKQRDEAKAAAFNESRSAFSRIAKTQAHHVQGGGSGNAWGLRNLGGKLAASVLNSATRKGEGQPVGSTALDVAFGRR